MSSLVDADQQERLSSADVALRYAAAGLSVVPIACDGTKEPPPGQTWKEFQVRIPSNSEIRRMFRKRVGIASICGAVTQFMMRQTRRMLFMARNHVADNPFHAECLKVMRKLREAPNQQLTHSVLLKRMKIDAKTFLDLIATLVEQGDLAAETVSTEGRSQRVYRLACGAPEG